MIFSGVGIISLICGYTDFKYRKIFNKITYPTMLLSLLYWIFTNGFDGFIFWGTGLLLGLSFLIIPFFLGGMGAGDVKMLGMIGAITGPLFVLKAFLWAAVLGGVFAAYCVLKLGLTRKDYFPYGVPIAIGVIIQIIIEVGII